MGRTARSSNQPASKTGTRQQAVPTTTSTARQRAQRPAQADDAAAGSSARNHRPIGRPHVVDDALPPQDPRSRDATPPRTPRRRPPPATSNDPEGDTSPRITLPTVPRQRAAARAAQSDPAATSPSNTRGYRTLLGIHRAEQELRDAPESRGAPEAREEPWDQRNRRGDWGASGASGPSVTSRRPAWDAADAPAGSDAWDGLPELPPRASGVRQGNLDERLTDSSGRLRRSSAARPLPSVPRRDRKLAARAVKQDEHRVGKRDDARGELDRDSRERPARTGERPATALALSTASVPDLIAYRPSAPRHRVDTRAILEKARKPWSLARMSLALMAIVLAIVTGYSAAGERPQPLMFSQADAGAGPAGDAPWPINAVTAKVQPETQLKRPDLYDSPDQMALWGPADCSAAVLSEVLTAYGVPGATIGRMVDELGPDISPHGGLMTYDGFDKVAQLHGYRADLYMDKPLTYKQMQYLTNTLGIPVIVNVHISYGYYRFFAGGHFMVMTYGDDQGVRLVDSSEYYVKYLPMDVFNSMFTQRTAVVVPKDYQYTLPS